MSQAMSQMNACKDCRCALIFDFDSGERVCPRCGSVIDVDNISLNPEWKEYTPEDIARQRRIGPPATWRHQDRGLSTTFSIVRDHYNNPLSQETIMKMYILRRRQKERVKERSTTLGLMEIARQADVLHLSLIVREASAELFHKVIRNNFLRGRAITAVTSACVYMACRKYGVAKTLQEIISISRSENSKLIIKFYRFLQEKLEITTQHPDPIAHLPRIVSELNMPPTVEKGAFDILKLAKEKGMIDGRSPTTMAAAAVYLSTVTLNIKTTTQEKIARAAHCCELSVRNCYKELKKVVQ